jgi:hypothetical protein
MSENTASAGNRLLVGAAIGVLAGMLGTIGVQRWTGRQQPPADTTQAAMVHETGQHVMPFALEKTQHIFEMTATGGIQDVIARDAADTAQIQLIQQHLQHEATRFAAGDFGDPSTVHGSDMPGLKQLAAGAARLSVTFSALPAGGRITFATADAALVTALHRWFGAQLSDHAGDATYR